MTKEDKKEEGKLPEKISCPMCNKGELRLCCEEDPRNRKIIPFALCTFVNCVYHGIKVPLVFYEMYAGKIGT